MPSINKQIALTLILGTMLILFFSIIMLFLFLIFRKRSVLFKQEKELMQLEYNQALLRSQLETQEQTFRNISQEIHDNIGQVLTLAKLNLSILGQQENHAPMLDDTKGLVTKAINDLRDLSKGLSPERVAGIDLAESIGHELQMLEKTNLYTTNLLINGSNYPLEKEKKIILFRIFQEVLNNILKHANATTITVQLDYDTNGFRLTVTDNGQGYDAKNQSNKGIGLQNIQNRSALIGATAHVTSNAESGTKVDMFLPKESDKL